MTRKKKRHTGKIGLLLAAGIIISLYAAWQEQRKPEYALPKKEEAKNQEHSGHAMGKEEMQPKETENLPAFSQLYTQKAGTVLDTENLPANILENLFYSQDITKETAERMQDNSYQDNADISLEELRYLRVLHKGLDGQTHIGELVVNQNIEQDILEIMKELYENNYPIEKMVLIDEYHAEDKASMEDNNTSAFNYRKITGSSKLSKHSLGLAIDINPRFNPCVRTRKTGEVMVEPVNGTEYANREGAFSYKIEAEDICVRLFLEHGFTWGGNWNSLKDYQHFEK